MAAISASPSDSKVSVRLLVDTGDIPFLYTRQGNELLTLFFPSPVTTPHALELQCKSHHIFPRLLYDDDDDDDER